MGFSCMENVDNEAKIFVDYNTSYNRIYIPTDIVKFLLDIIKLHERNEYKRYVAWKMCKNK